MNNNKAPDQMCHGMRNGGAGDEEEASVTWQQMEEAGLCLVCYPACHTMPHTLSKCLSKCHEHGIVNSIDPKF